MNNGLGPWSQEGTLQNFKKVGKNCVKYYFPQLLRGKRNQHDSQKNMIKFPKLAMGEKNQIFKNSYIFFLYTLILLLVLSVGNLKNLLRSI